MERDIKKVLKNINFEALIWLGGLIYLAFISIESTHFTICPFNNLGIDFCPGCGLGASIHHLFNFEFEKSFTAHPLGIFALFVLIYRILTLSVETIRRIRKLKLSYNQE